MSAGPAVRRRMRLPAWRSAWMLAQRASSSSAGVAMPGLVSSAMSSAGVSTG